MRKSLHNESKIKSRNLKSEPQSKESPDTAPYEANGPKMASRDANTPESISHHTDTISNGTSEKSTIASTPSLTETKTEYNVSNPSPLEPNRKGAIEFKAAKNKDKNKANADKPLQSQQPAPDPLGDFENHGKQWKLMLSNSRRSHVVTTNCYNKSYLLPQFEIAV